MRLVVSEGLSMKFRSPHKKVGKLLVIVRRGVRRLVLKTKSPPDLK